MVCCGVLMGLVLLSLLPPAAWAEISNLAKIITFLQENYGEGSAQFAVAINVPAQKCSADLTPDQNFLPGDNATKAKKDMKGPQSVYQGKRLMGARPRRIPGSKSNYHSEYLLLIQPYPPSNDTLVKTLLARYPDGCVIFYTLNSPCVQTCSTPNKRYSIIPALGVFRNHNGPKAFVFGQVWKHDENVAQWETNMKEVNKNVPLYRCSGGVCTLCVDNNDVVNARCRDNSHHG
ncbi:uncharacterized protein [Salminus brasiliensis]|uniref:uncharacterized protein n=1 Tax=Salminus brasiliensis TaxID=930266 RepID=UPI003B8342BB